MELLVHPVTADRWPDLEALFGPKGAFANCWCMAWRMERKEFNRLPGEEKRAALHELTCTNKVPGLLAYEDGRPIGWCSAGPREQFAALEKSRSLKRIDDQPVWSIVCFYVAKKVRRRGVMAALLRGVLTYAAQQGAHIVEGYPLDMESPQWSGQNLRGYAGFMGIASVYREAGFVEIGRASETQLIMRHVVQAVSL